MRDRNRGLRWSMGVLAFLAGLVLANGAHAYVLTKTSTCSPGAKWGTLNTVKVRLLTDSFVDYEADHGITDLRVLQDLRVLLQDVEAVIAEYNSIDDLSLELEYAGGIVGDDNLEEYDVDDFNNHSVIVGFTDLVNENNPTAPAWAPANPDDDCKFSERHILFRKPQTWVFGPPPTTDVNGKSFSGGTSFRAVLLHEMGHAVGLAHAVDTYAVMDHGTKAWTRGPNEIPQMELLPDDIKGLRALYGNGGTPNFDISVTNTWFLSADEVPDDNAASQTQNCLVSSRGDSYAERADGLVFCGVNDVPTEYPLVSDTVCPGDYLQIRYTLNNKGDEAVQVEEQLWLSLDDDLEVNGAAVDIRSEDVREFVLDAGRSASIGRVFRVPADTPDGVYRIYPRAVPYSLLSGLSLWDLDEDQWNNSIRVRGEIAVDSSACR